MRSLRLGRGTVGCESDFAWLSSMSEEELATLAFVVWDGHDSYAKVETYFSGRQIGKRAARKLSARQSDEPLRRPSSPGSTPGRLRFGGAAHGDPFPSAVVVFRNANWRYETRRRG